MESPRARITHSASIVRGEDRKASETLDSFQKIVDLDFGVAVVAIVDLGAFAKKRVRFVEQRTALPAFVASKTRLKFLSVSPRYLLTTWLKSMRYRSVLSSLARVWAATSAPDGFLPMNSRGTPWGRAGVELRTGCVRAPD